LVADYAEIGKNLWSCGSHSWEALEGGRWSLVERCTVAPGEAPQLRETETMGYFCDIHYVWIGIP
jgi:hypothetical protein